MTRTLRSHPMPAIAALCVMLAALTLVLPASHSFDPWSWIVWGREVMDGALETETGPSWKPLPVLFTSIFSLFGDIAPDLWMVVARAGTFAAVAASAALGFRLAGRLGALTAGGLVLVVPWFWQTTLLGNSEGLLLACVLAAVERHLAGRHGQAFAFGVAAGLLRPEAWPFLGLYGLWLVVRDRRRLLRVAAALALQPLLWLLPELWGSGNLWRAAERAQSLGPNAPGNAERPALEVLRNAIELTPAVGFVGLLAGVVAVALGRVDRRRVVEAGGIAALAAAWLLLVMVMTEFGFSGTDRYLFTPVLIALALGGVGLAWAVAPLLTVRPRPKPAVAVAAVLVVLTGIGLSRFAVQWPGTLRFVERHGVVTDDLDRAVARAGGARPIERCGAVYTDFFLIPPVAWALERHLEDVGWRAGVPGVALRAHLLPRKPVWPPREAFAGAQARQLLARTEHWEVEAACR